MQTSLTFATDNRLPEILARAEQLAPPQGRITDPLSQLVFAVIAEDAAPAVGLAVYKRLRATCPRWSDLRDASPETLARVLVGTRGAAAKAEALPAIIREIEAERGVIDLDFLRRMTTEQASRWLERLPGVTASTAAAVLSFSDLRRSVVAVDQRSARPIRRLGLAPTAAPISALPRHVAERAPSSWGAPEFSALARGLGKLGRTVCTDGKPDCGACPMADLCPSARRATADVMAFPGRPAADAA